MKIALLSGAYPPALDGIGDHTFRLAREMAGNVLVLTSDAGRHVQIPGVEVVGFFNPHKPRTITALPEALAGRGVSKLVLQYNPFGFGPRGFNPWLPRALTRAKASCGLTISVMFHETYVPPENLRFLMMLAFQYPQFAAVVRVADELFCSTGRWIPQIRRIVPGCNVTRVPVGSNIDLSRLTRGEARAALGIPERRAVLAMFGSAHVSRLLPWIATAAKAIAMEGRETLLLSIGPDGDEVRRVCGAETPLLDCGVVDASKAGDFLMAADAMVAPFIDGLSTRRGSVAAAFQHGLPVLSTSSRWTDEILLNREGLELFPVGDGIGGFARFAAGTMQRWAGNAPDPAAIRAFYRQNFDWPRAAAALSGS